MQYIKLLIDKNNSDLKNKINRNYFYAPRGLLVDYKDEKLLEVFISELKKYAKANNGYVIKFDPVIPRFQRNIDGNKVDKGFDNEWIVKKIESLGCKHLGYSRGTDVSKQVNWVFELDLKNKLPLLSYEEKLKILSSDGMLIKRPILELSNDILNYAEDFHSVFQSLLHTKE